VKHVCRTDSQTKNTTTNNTERSVQRETERERDRQRQGKISSFQHQHNSSAINHLDTNIYSTARRPLLSKVKSWIKASTRTRLSYGTSPAIWDHTVLPATRHKWTRPTLTLARKLPLDLPTPEGWRVSWPRLPGNAPTGSRSPTLEPLHYRGTGRHQGTCLIHVHAKKTNQKAPFRQRKHRPQLYTGARWCPAGGSILILLSVDQTNTQRQST